MPGEAVDRLNELVHLVDGPLVKHHAAHATAAVRRDVAGYDAVIDDYEQLDALGIAAEAAAELADLHRAGGDTRQAVAAQQRSEELAARAGGLGTPVMARGAGVEPLTRREREVALMAAGGRSNREIGQRLHLSTRTVDTHLARVYRKLGITRRAELPEVLGTSRT